MPFTFVQLQGISYSGIVFIPKKREIFSLMLHLHTLKIMGGLEIVRPCALAKNKVEYQKPKPQNSMIFEAPNWFTCNHV